MSRRIDPFEIRARELCVAAGQDPESRVAVLGKERGMPAWCGFRAAAKAESVAATQAAVAKQLPPQSAAYQNSPLRIFGEHEASTIAQMRNCMSVGNAVSGVICADGHLGYAQPVGGVIAYEKQISISGVGFDIGCGNMAVRLDTRFEDIKDRVAVILADIRKTISFGVGRINETRVEHALFDDNDAWIASGMEDYRQKARTQLGTVGSGNHYVDLMTDEAGYVWIGVHFGSRGLGHTSATRYLKLAGGVDGMNVPPAVVDEDSEVGIRYLAAMELAGRYAYAGREWAVENVRQIVGGRVEDAIHNHHNFCIAGDQLIPTINGPVMMKNIKPGDILYSFDENSGITECAVKDHWLSGKKKIYKINTANRSIRVSGNHPIQVIELKSIQHPTRPWNNKSTGSLVWKEAKDIKFGDIIVCAHKYYNSVNNIDWCAKFSRFVGAFLGDGWVRSNPTKQGHTVGLAIGNPEETHTKKYFDLMQDIFPEVNWRMNGSGEFGIVGASKEVYNELKNLGLSGTSHTKRLPYEVFRLSLENKINLLSGYMDADGSVANEATSNHGRGTMCCVNFELMRDLRELAISCGMRITPISKEYRKTNFSDCVVYRCTISANSVKMLDMWHENKNNNSRNTVFGDKFALQTKKIGYMTLPENVFAQTVISVIEEAEDDVFDLSIDSPSHAFVCEGMIVHNCWREVHSGRDLWVVRKGATPAFPGQRGFVGGSMGDDAVIVEGVDSEASAASLYSTIHGAGRTMGRMAAKRTFTKQQMDEWLQARGVMLAGGDLDESPMAYRRLPDVLAHHAGTIRVLHTLRPFAVAMAGNGEYDPYKD